MTQGSAVLSACRIFAAHRKERAMQRNEQRPVHGLTDLGAASTETKGSPITQKADLFQLGRDVPGISDD
jgi:hypothetical protein